MPDGPAQPRKSEHVALTVEDSVTVSDTAEARVAQAQVQIAEAAGQANDATVRIDQLAEAASTAEEREVVYLFRTINTTQKAISQEMLKTLQAVHDELG